MESRDRMIGESPWNVLRESALGLVVGFVAGLLDVALMGLGFEIGSQVLGLGAFVLPPVLVAGWVGLGLWRKARWWPMRVRASNGLALGVITFVGGIVLSLMIFRHIAPWLFGPL